MNSQLKHLSSSEFEILSSTDPLEEGLSEREIKKRTDPDLLALSNARISVGGPSMSERHLN